MVRRRHLLDLPDEILSLILRYCFQDMDFLLWSCPFIKTENQFCHDCYHCSLCHDPLNESNRKHSDFNSSYNKSATRTRRLVSESSIDIANRSNCLVNCQNIGISESTSNQLGVISKGNHSDNCNLINNATSDTVLRKQRRRTFAKGDQQVESSRPRDRNQPCSYDQRQEVELESRSFWSRGLARFGFRSRRHAHSYPLLSSSVSPAFNLPSPVPNTKPSAILLRSHKSRRVHHFPDSDDLEEVATDQVPRVCMKTEVLLPIAFLESLPLPQSQLSHVSPQPKGYSKGSYEIQNVEKENVHSILPIPSHTTKRRPRSSNLNAAAYSYLRAINRSHPLPSLDGDAGELNRQDYTDNGSSETNSNTFWRSTPFQLLLVNKRLASIVVQLLWGATVFHGHDVGQMESLISTLYKNDHQDLSESNLRDIERLQDFDKRKYSSYAKPGLKGVSLASSSFIMQQSTQTTQLRHHAQPCISRSEGDCQGEIENLLSTKGGSASLRDVGSSYNCSHPCHYATVTESQCECFVKDITGDPTPISNEALWPYHQLVKRVVLNFAHPQASPQLLVRALDCIKSRCQNQIQAFDLRANEKMQAAGLESVSELERLFGSGFSKLRYLRLQGGLVDNQLLGALIKGLSAPTITSCCLSQVFLGPGSVTDSAIDKLIKTAGHSIEVFAVTSCVDISGGALAGLLTKCPKLRVLSVQRSLAKDKELFEGLCIEFKERLPSLSTSTAFLSPSAQSLSQNPIIAPLERLELGTVKLTEVGVAEIIKGTCLTLRFLALEMQHFKEDFLKSTIAPLCKRLEGLYFVESDHVTQQQRQQQGMQGQGNEEQRSRRRLFDFGRSRRTLGAQHQHQQLRHHDYSISDSRVLEQHSLSRISPRPKQSPWLGETSTEEWVQYGDCALWAASTIGSAILPRSGRSRNSMDNTNAGNALTNQSLRARSFSAYFRAIGQRLVSMLSTSNSTIGQDTDALIDTENHALSTDPLPSEIVGNDYENMLKRFGVSPRTIESVLLTLQPSLKVFNAMQTDVIQAAMVAPDEIPATSSTDIVLCSEMTQRDRLETFLRLVVLLGALVIGAAASLQSVCSLEML